MTVLSSPSLIWYPFLSSVFTPSPRQFELPTKQCSRRFNTLADCSLSLIWYPFLSSVFTLSPRWFELPTKTVLSTVQHPSQRFFLPSLSFDTHSSHLSSLCYRGNLSFPQKQCSWRFFLPSLSFDTHSSHLSLLRHRGEVENRVEF